MRSLGLIEDGAVFIVDGVIQAVGPSRRIENLAEARNALEISADGRVVMPGFVDCRTHLICPPARLPEQETLLEETPTAGGGWPVPETFASVRHLRQISTRRMEMVARKLLRQFVRYGTTTLEAGTGYGLDETTEMRTLRVYKAIDKKPLDVEATFLGARAVPPEYERRSGEYLQRILQELLPKVAQRKLARYAGITCGEGGFTPQESLEFLRAARELGLHTRIHLEGESLAAGAAAAVQGGAASADHLAAAGEQEARLLANSPTVATLLPGYTYHLGSERYPPARLFIDTGVAVSLASGFTMDTCPTWSMPMVLSLACARMRMTPAEAITAATINAAHALRRASTLGSLEYGKQADLIMVDAPDYREIPYHFGVNLVALTIKRGEVLHPRVEYPWPES